MSDQAVLTARGLRFSRGDAPVLDDVSLEVRRGEFVALVGPNGAGKTTLLKVLLGLLQPQSGQVLLFGQDPRDMKDRQLIGYVPQRPGVAAGLPATVEEVVTTGRLSSRRWWRRAARQDRDAVDHALMAVGLESDRHRRVSELSGGEQQRAFIARAMASDPQLLVLDEPVAGVDAEAQERFRESVVHHVRDHEGAVLLVSHELGAVASDLDRVIVLKTRIRFDGSPAELTQTGVSLGIHSEDLPAWLEELR
ncbi:MAG TPA: metal ABC transporter ATP-binding protein [Actinomycetota bacterium]|nr:metal ABC transporter ATP-binding protein [Actinomycetota bacterium]